jgi:hypothetical protein
MIWQKLMMAWKIFELIRADGYEEEINCSCHVRELQILIANAHCHFKLDVDSQ